MHVFQKILLWIYRRFQKLGLLEKAWFKKIFWTAYFLYKRHFEDPFYGLTQRYPALFQGGNILDIGANIGYTSVVFSKAITSGFRVYAFEPDYQNSVSLRQIIKLNQQKERIIPIQAAVGETQGTIQLWHNQNHHADHRIATKEFKDLGRDLKKVSTVDLWSVDSFVFSKLDRARVKFIKIDVQGYEFPVCLGMKETLVANPDAVIALEYMPASVEELGFDPEKIIGFFQEREYFMYVLGKQGNLELAREQLVNKLVKQRGYIDLLFSREPLLN
ncbi:MAG: FkbM family methyltransferase [Cyanophyceae cyanobacterium]